LIDELPVPLIGDSWIVAGRSLHDLPEAICVHPLSSRALCVRCPGRRLMRVRRARREHQHGASDRRQETTGDLECSQFRREMPNSVAHARTHVPILPDRGRDVTD